MHCKRLSTILAGFISLVAPALGQQELIVHYPQGAPARHGTLRLEARDSSLKSLGSTARVELKVTPQSGPPGLVEAGELASTVEGTTLAATVPFCRDVAEPAKFTLSLMVKETQKDLTFVSRQIKIDPLPVESDEDSKPCGSSQPAANGQPSAGSENLKVSFVAVSYTGKGLGSWWPFGSARYDIHAILKANSDVKVSLVVKNADLDQAPKSVDLKKNIETPVPLSAELTDFTVLSVSGPSTDGAMSEQAAYPIPRRYGPLGGDRDLGQAFMVFLWIILLGFLSWIIWLFRWVFLNPKSVLPQYRAWRESSRARRASRRASEPSAGHHRNSTVEGEPGKAPPAATEPQGKSGEAPSRPVTIEDLQNRIDTLTNDKEMLQMSVNSLEEKLKGWTPPPLPPPPPSVPPGEYPQALVAVLNRWWQGDNPDRSRLREMLAQIGLPAKFYGMTNIEGAMTSVSWNGPYSFQPLERDGGWLWCDLPAEGEAIVLPADPAFFDTGAMQKILQRVVSGCEAVQSKPRFLDASSPCKVRREEDGYRFTQKGTVRVEGQSQPRGYVKKGRSLESFLPPPAPKPNSDLAANVLAGVTVVVERGLRDSVAQILSEIKPLQRAKPDAPPAAVQVYLSGIENKFANAAEAAVQKASAAKILPALIELRKALVAEMRAMAHPVEAPPGGTGSGAVSGEGGQQANPNGLVLVVAADIATEVRDALDSRFVELRQLIEETRPSLPSPDEIRYQGTTGSPPVSGEQQTEPVADFATDLELRIAGRLEVLRSSLVAEIRSGVPTQQEVEPVPPPVDLDEIRSCVAQEIASAIRQEMAGQKSLVVEMAEIRKSWIEEMRNALVELSAKLMVPAPVNGKATTDVGEIEIPADAESAPDGREWWSEDELRTVYGKASDLAEGEYVHRLQAFTQLLAADFPGVSFRLSHLNLTAKEIAIHSVQVQADGLFRCDECESRAAFQLFATTENHQTGVWHVLLPPGDFQMYNFSFGYPLLMNPTPPRPGNFTVRSVTRPARLKRALGKADSYVVADRMNWS